MSARPSRDRSGYAQIDERVKDGNHRFEVDRVWDDDRRKVGDDVRHSDPASDSSANQDTSEQDGCKEKMTSVFCRYERTTGEIRVTGARVEWDVLDVVMS